MNYKKQLFAFVVGLLCYSQSMAFAESKCPPCWAGWYAGVHAGWAWSALPYKINPFGQVAILEVTPHSGKDHLMGALFGGQVGFNKQLNRWVFGVESDLAVARINGFDSTTFRSIRFFPVVSSTNHTSLNAHFNCLASLRGRLGIGVQRGLLYVTGGAALGHLVIHTFFDAQVLPQGFNTVGEDKFKKTLFAWVIGSGYEHRFKRCWSVRAEYLHYQFDRGFSNSFLYPNSPPNGARLSIGHICIDEVRVGVNYFFGRCNKF